MQLSVRDSLDNLSDNCLELLNVIALFPTGAPVLSCVVEEVWQSCCTDPQTSFWVSTLCPSYLS